MEFPYDEEELKNCDNYNNTQEINRFSSFNIDGKPNKINAYYKSNRNNYKEKNKFNTINNSKIGFQKVNYMTNMNYKKNNSSPSKRGNSSNQIHNIYKNKNLFTDLNNNGQKINNIYGPMLSPNKNKNIRNFSQTRHSNNNNYLEKSSNNLFAHYDNIILNKSIKSNNRRYNNIINLNNANINNKKRNNNRYQQNLIRNNFQSPKTINSFNNCSINNNININFNNNRCSNNFLKHQNYISNKKVNNRKRINLVNNDINKNNIDVHNMHNSNIFRKKRIIEQKFHLLNYSEDLSKLAEDLYNYHLKQKNQQIILRENNFSNNYFSDINNINIDKEDEKEINFIKIPFSNNQNEKIIENNFQFEINEKSRNKNFNDNQNIDENKDYDKKYFTIEKFDFRTDIHKNYFNDLQFKSFQKHRDNNIIIYNEEDESKEESINILNNFEDEKDDNILFDNTHNSPLNQIQNRNLLNNNKMENENELINKEDSKYSNHIYDADNEEDLGKSVLGQKYINSENEEAKPNSNINALENANIRANNEEEIKENENNELNLDNRLIDIEDSIQRANGMMRYILFRFFEFDPEGNENEYLDIDNNNNQSNVSSFYSFNENNNTIFGSTQLSIHESNNNSNIQSENASLNNYSSNEEKNLSQELLICSGEKTEDKK